MIAIAASLFAACEMRDISRVNQPAANSQNLNTNTSANTQQPELPAHVAALQVTLPLLDAMLTDESFMSEVRKAMQISDDELAKIRDAAKNEVLQLGSVDEDDLTRSTRASVEKTRNELGKILGAQRTEQFLNLAKLRWAGSGNALEVAPPNSVPTDTRIVVNAPAYRMDLFKDGNLIKTYKIGIGYPEFPLPAGLRKAAEIIFNPSWTPPDEPWVKGKLSPGEKIEAGSKLNPLGPIKIPIGLPSLIHGGKSPSRLGNFASHGCVGLTDELVRDFAARLAELSGTPLSAEKITAYGRTPSQTETVKLGQSIPVELRYETIVAENGKVTIYRDVYEKGSNTEEDLRRVMGAQGVSFDQLSEVDRSTLIAAIEEMSLPADGQIDRSANTNGRNSTNSNTGKVTRNVKGKKEILIPVAALNGKGYPSPVGVENK
jgi:hypothetical protein